MDIEDYLEKQKERVNGALIYFLPQAGPARVRDAMRYSLQAGGKRLRPILTLAVAAALETEDDSVLAPACAVELIHTYSLVHDDLPAMDDSDLRRGKPSCHRVFGEALAVLAGDALLTLAFEILAGYGRSGGRAAQALEMIDTMARAAGVSGMLGGQVLDLEAEKAAFSLPEIETMQSMKTGALIKGAVRCGALAGGAKQSEEEALDRYAGYAGLAFQVVDDLLDLESTAAELGKPAGADRSKAKATLPAQLGAAEARRRAEELYYQALESLSLLDRDTRILAALAQKLVFRSR